MLLSVSLLLHKVTNQWRTTIPQLSTGNKLNSSFIIHSQLREAECGGGCKYKTATVSHWLRITENTCRFMLAHSFNIQLLHKWFGVRLKLGSPLKLCYFFLCTSAISGESNVELFVNVMFCIISLISCEEKLPNVPNQCNKTPEYIHTLISILSCNFYGVSQWEGLNPVVLYVLGKTFCYHRKVFNLKPEPIFTF